MGGGFGCGGLWKVLGREWVGFVFGCMGGFGGLGVGGGWIELGMNVYMRMRIGGVVWRCVGYMSRFRGVWGRG